MLCSCEWFSLVKFLEIFLSVSSGVFVFTNHNLFKTLWTWVSTQIYGASSITAKKTLAVFIQTYGSFVNSSIVFGIWELYCFSKILQVL